jgi:FkbM family methyltransferase
MQMHLNIQRLYRNTRTLFATRGMPLALGEFILRRGLMGSGPYIATSGGYHVGFAPWLSFSEYWSYRGGDFGDEPSNGISRWLRDLLRHWPIETTSIAVDVGANIGIFTLEFAGLGFRQVHAFEPVPETCRRLQRNVDRNRVSERVRVNCTALAERDGWLCIDYDPRSPATSYVSPRGERVPCQTLDTYASVNQLAHVDLLKLDVEGWEVRVLRGARQLLADGRIDLILVEWAPDLLERAGSSGGELWSVLTRHGYCLWRVCRHGLLPIARLQDLAGVKWGNLVASRGLLGFLGGNERLAEPGQRAVNQCG